LSLKHYIVGQNDVFIINPFGDINGITLIRLTESRFDRRKIMGDNNLFARKTAVDRSQNNNKSYASFFGEFIVSGLLRA